MFEPWQVRLDARCVCTFVATAYRHHCGIIVDRSNETETSKFPGAAVYKC